MARDDGGVESSTRDRLLDAGMRLFATQGFKATTVGAVEAAAGLQPRRGALYKHFASKEALLEAAVARHLDSVEIGAAQLNQLTIPVTGDDLDMLRGLIVELGRWFLSELDRQEAMTRVLEQDGDRLDDVRRLAHERIVDAGYNAAAGLARDALGPEVDAEALAVVLMGSLIALRRTTWTFGAPPMAMDDDRVLATWADVCLSALRT